MYLLLWFVILITSEPCPALRLNIQQEGDTMYEELVVDENGEDSVKDKNNKTKTPLIGTAIFKIPKHEEQSLEDIYMAQNGFKLEDLISMRDQIEDFIMNEIYNRINSNVTTESYSTSQIVLEPDDIISEDKIKTLGNKL